LTQGGIGDLSLAGLVLDEEERGGGKKNKQDETQAGE